MKAYMFARESIGEDSTFDELIYEKDIFTRNF